MQEISQKIELCWIIDTEWEKFYKECTIESLQDARNKRRDIRVWDSILYKNGEMIKKTWDIILTSFQIAKYWKADTADVFIYLSLPKYPDYIQKKLKTAVANMWREQRNSITYEAISQTIKRWIHEENYYS